MHAAFAVAAASSPSFHARRSYAEQSAQFMLKSFERGSNAPRDSKMFSDRWDRSLGKLPVIPGERVSHEGSRARQARLSFAVQGHAVDPFA